MYTFYTYPCWFFFAKQVYFEYLLFRWNAKWSFWHFNPFWLEWWAIIELQKILYCFVRETHVTQRHWNGTQWLESRQIDWFFWIINFFNLTFLWYCVKTLINRMMCFSAASCFSDLVIPKLETKARCRSRPWRMQMMFWWAFALIWSIISALDWSPLLILSAPLPLHNGFYQRPPVVLGGKDFKRGRDHTKLKNKWLKIEIAISGQPRGFMLGSPPSALMFMRYDRPSPRVLLRSSRRRLLFNDMP